MLLLGVEIGEMSDDGSVVQSLPPSPVPSMASDVEGTSAAAAAPGADDSQVAQIQQARKRIKEEQNLMKKQAMNEQQVLKERLKVAKTKSATVTEMMLHLKHIPLLHVAAPRLK